MSNHWAKPQTAQATAEQTSAERTEYLQDGMREVRCERCAAVVLAAKRGPEHTAVQWNAASEQACFVLEHGQPRGCAWLRSSIEQAASAGRFDEVPT